VRSGNCKQARALFILFGPQPGLIYKLLCPGALCALATLLLQHDIAHVNARRERHEIFDAWALAKIGAISKNSPGAHAEYQPRLIIANTDSVPRDLPTQKVLSKR
jgi:hypothetical protein